MKGAADRGRVGGRARNPWPGTVDGWRCAGRGVVDSGLTGTTARDVWGKVKESGHDAGEGRREGWTAHFLSHGVGTTRAACCGGSLRMLGGGGLRPWKEKSSGAT